MVFKNFLVAVAFTVVGFSNLALAQTYDYANTYWGLGDYLFVEGYVNRDQYVPGQTLAAIHKFKYRNNETNGLKHIVNVKVYIKDDMNMFPASVLNYSETVSPGGTLTLAPVGSIVAQAGTMGYMAWIEIEVTSLAYPLSKSKFTNYIGYFVNLNP